MPEQVTPPKPPLTMQNHWKAYRDACYKPGTLQPEVNKQLHQAFFAGAFALYGIQMDLTGLPEAENETAIAKLFAEVEQTCRLNMTPPYRRN